MTQEEILVLILNEKSLKWKEFYGREILEMIKISLHQQTNVFTVKSFDWIFFTSNSGYNLLNSLNLKMKKKSKNVKYEMNTSNLMKTYVNKLFNSNPA